MAACETGAMLDTDPKAVWKRYLDQAHEAMLWKLDGVSEYDLRRPLTPTGTNLLGLVKHVGWVELGYFSLPFGRDPGVELAEPTEVNADMFATADETVDDIVQGFRTAWAFATATIDELDLDAEGTVPWWGPNNPVTLELILVHLTTEIHRHLGQIDILREQLDGAVGHRVDVDNMPPVDEAFWPDYVARLEAIAAGFRDGTS